MAAGNSIWSLRDARLLVDLAELAHHARVHQTSLSGVEEHGPRHMQPRTAQGGARTDPMAEPFGAKGSNSKTRFQSSRRDRKICGEEPEAPTS